VVELLKNCYRGAPENDYCQLDTTWSSYNQPDSSDYFTYIKKDSYTEDY
jgi:hypothetical protein